MGTTPRRSRIIIAAVAALGLAAGAPGAMAHEGGSRCTAKMTPKGDAGYFDATCISPFQGFPVGVAGVYRADDPELGPSPLDSDIHVEIYAILNNGTARPLGVECVQPNGKDVTRCFHEYNPITSDPTGPISITAPEPLPADIVGLKCMAHSHATYPSSAKPSGNMACWSTDEAREDLYADHWFRDNGFPPPAAE